MTIDELTQALEAARKSEPSASVESAIAVYQMASAEADQYDAVKDAAKQLIQDVMTETGVTAYSTQAGKASITAPSVSVSFDTKALDVLMRDDPDIAMRLSPYRKETMRAGSLRITAAK